MPTSRFQWLVETDIRDRNRTEAMHAMPGETLRVRAWCQDGFPAEIGVRQGILTVTATFVHPGLLPGTKMVRYVFEEVDGEHDACLFEDSRGPEPMFGIVIGRMNSLWFARCDPSGQDAVPTGVLLQLDRDLGRPARWQIASTTRAMETFFDAREDQPLRGDFLLAPTGSGNWMLTDCAWSYPARREEVGPVSDLIEKMAENHS